MAQVLDPIFLDVQLWDLATDKHVLAVIKADGNELPYSPVTVPHVANGKHELSNPSVVNFPTNTQHYSIDYYVYNDAGFTSVSKRHAPANEHYVLNNPIGAGNEEVINKINQLIDIVTSHDVGSQIIGLVNDDEDMLGFVLTDEIVGEVPDEEILIGEVLSDEEIIALANEDEDLIGGL